MSVLNSLQIPLWIYSLLSLSLLYGNESIQYQYYTHQSPKRLIHHFKINPRRVHIELIQGTESCLGLERVSDIARRKEATLSINGGYFQGGAFLGAPDGPFMIQGLLCGYRSKLTGALGWSDWGQNAHIDRIKMDIKLLCRGQSFRIDAINRKAYPKNNVLYTSNFNRTTLAHKGASIFCIDQIIKPLPQENNGVSIPSQGWLFVQGKEVKKKIPLFLMHKPASIQARLVPTLNPTMHGKWKSFRNIVNGIVILSENRLIQDYHTEEVPDLITKPRHARTAIGIDDNGWWNIVIVEGNHHNHIGMSMNELGNLMKTLRCRFALSLDGGGSSTFYYKGKVQQFLAHHNHLVRQNNFYYHPEGGERPVGNALIFKPR